MKNEELIEELLRAAVGGNIDENKLASLAALYGRGDPNDLLSDFAEFVSRRFVDGMLDFTTANDALNQVMPIAGFENAPPRFWEAYIAFEDFETVADPDRKALPRIRELIAGWNAA